MHFFAFWGIFLRIIFKFSTDSPRERQRQTNQHTPRQTPKTPGNCGHWTRDDSLNPTPYPQTKKSGRLAPEAQRQRVAHANWLWGVRSGLQALEFYSPADRKWRQAHMQGPGNR